MSKRKNKKSRSTGRWEGRSRPTPTRTLRPHFPPELCDRVMDHLYHDQATLKACSLVSKSWLPSSRHHLSKAINVHRWNCGFTLSILDSPLCTIKPSVHVLKINCRSPDDWVNEELLPCLSHLHSVKSLSLTLFESSEINIWDFSKALPNLEHLAVEECGSESLDSDTVIDLVNCYTVERLSLLTTQGSCTRELNPGLCSGLRMLQLSASWVNYFSESCHLPRVDTLKLHRDDGNHSLNATQLLRNVAGSLLHLTVIENNRYHASPVGGLDAIPNLQTIDLGHVNLLFQKSLPLIKSITSTCVEEITLRFWVTSWKFAAPINVEWEKKEALGNLLGLDDALVGAQFPCLQGVKIWCGWSWFSESVHLFMQKALPKCHERGLLQIFAEKRR